MSKIDKTISLLKRGYITSLDSARYGGVLSLSQRIGDLRKETCAIRGKIKPRYEILDLWITTQSGSRVKAWFIARDNVKA